MKNAWLVALLTLSVFAAFVIALMSWPERHNYGRYPLTGFHTLEDLKNAETDAVVAGVFSAVQRTTRDSGETLHTYFAFNVKQVLWDPQHRIKGPSITIYQMGGIEGRTTGELEDDPLFRVNEEAILFLHEYETGSFQVRAGPAGRFTLVDDQVMTVGNDGLNFDKPIPKADFINMMRSRGYGN